MEFKMLCKTCVNYPFDCGFHAVDSEGEPITYEEPDEQYCSKHGACLNYTPYLEEIYAALDELEKSHDISIKAKEILWLAMEDYDQLWDRRSPIHERDIVIFAMPLLEWELFARRYALSGETIVKRKKAIKEYIYERYLQLSMRLSRIYNMVEVFMQEETPDVLAHYIIQRYDYYHKDKIMEDVLRFVTKIKKSYLYK